MTASTCAHCGAPVIEAVLRGTGRDIYLDPEPTTAGSFQLIEPGSVASFIPKEYRDPTSRYFVPPTDRYQSHMASCVNRMRTNESVNART